MPKSLDKARILVVDDNPAVLKLIGSLFEEEGMSVRLAESVAEARAALEAAAWDFDLVLSDISMPGESGFDLLGWIKRDESPNKDLPVLLTTAQLPEAENRVKGLAMGAVDYVVRPIELKELVLRAMHAIEHFRRVRSLERSLQDSENLAMIGRLLAASHHEIKNLAAIVSLAASQTAKTFMPVAEGRGKEALRALTQSSELLTDVSRNVASLLNPEGIVLKPVDLQTVVRDVVEMMGSRVRPHRLTVASSQQALWAMAHAVRVKQVLINLILNASDAIRELESEAGGSITVTLASDGATCSISVKDDGIGFNPPGTRREFKPFSTTKSLRGGQGLGLWLCATLTRNMGGTLSLSSTGVGDGATATMTLATSAGPEDDLDVQRYLDELS